MATVMIMPVHIPVSKTSPMTPQPDSTDNSGAKHAIFKCLIIMRARTKVLTFTNRPQPRGAARATKQRAAAAELGDGREDQCSIHAKKERSARYFFFTIA